ncbi:Hsp20/alpha crystallin family protein [Noviherbaspirillum sp.]|uniref:Hsp20/alpha crystallin family protein n=1 Tax=Noviherbaspirillum sp. TaxID=1926288 RepID=UPI002B475CE6|nr:Hsp20/alpha crystallin family protein [Noviherbaspirillum sp.]HJV80487.1 Hsp20/alpha crystallin family protein [Noviherbaspirillum sp.]
MANLTRFDPFSDMMRFDPFRNMDDFFKEFSMMPSLRGMEAEPRIRMDVAETEQAYQIKADIPGVKKEDIKVAIDGNVVSIRAETKEEKEEKMEGNMVRKERHYGEQYRSFTLPQDVDESKVEARYQDGVLSLMLPKKAGGTTKQITIQ